MIYMKGINFLNWLRSKFIKKQDSHNDDCPVLYFDYLELSFNDRLIDNWGNTDIYGPWTQIIESNQYDSKLFIYKEYYIVSYNDNVDIKKIHEKIMEDKRREKLEVRRKKLISLQSE